MQDFLMKLDPELAWQNSIQQEEALFTSKFDLSLRRKLEIATFEA
jgi:hypothetical protein